MCMYNNNNCRRGDEFEMELEQRGERQREMMLTKCAYVQTSQKMYQK